MSDLDTTKAVYTFAINFRPINLVIAAALVLFAVYKMLSHPSGPAAGLAAAFDGLLWLMVGIVGRFVELYEALARSLAVMAVGNCG